MEHLIGTPPSGVEQFPETNGRILAAHLDGVAPSDWVVQTATALMQRFRSDSAEGVLATSRTIVLLTFPAGDEIEVAAHRSATIQSARGIVQSLTREFAHSAQPMNVVAVSSNALNTAATTLEFLDSENGAYMAGSTIDLTQEIGAHS